MRQTIFILGLIFISLSFCGCKDDKDTPSFGYLSPFSGVYSPAFESRLLQLTVNSEEKSDATVSFSSSDMTTASITLNNVIEGYEKFEIREVILKNYGSRSKKGEFLRFELSHNALNRKPQK